MDNAWQNAYDNNPRALQDIETRLQCCGYETVTDRAIPKSSKLACRQSPAFGYDISCKDQLKHSYSRHEAVILGVITAVEILQVYYALNIEAFSLRMTMKFTHSLIIRFSITKQPM